MTGFISNLGVLAICCVICDVTDAMRVCVLQFYSVISCSNACDCETHPTLRLIRPTGWTNVVNVPEHVTSKVVTAKGQCLPRD